jgi:hypothetical protein
MRVMLRYGVTTAEADFLPGWVLEALLAAPAPAAGPKPPRSFATMRQFVQSSAIAHACVAFRASQVTAMDWDIRAGDGEWRTRALWGFAHPDRDYPFRTWVSRAVTEVMTTDTLVLYVRRPPEWFTADPSANRGPRMELLDGACVLPRPARLGLSGLPAMDGAEGDVAMAAATGLEFTAPAGFREIAGEDGRTTIGRLLDFLKATFDQILADWPGAPAMEFQWKPEPDYEAFAGESLKLSEMIAARPLGWPRE